MAGVEANDSHHIRERDAEIARLEVRLRAPRRAAPNIEKLRDALTQRAAEWKAKRAGAPMITKRQVTFLWIAALIATTAAAGFETAAAQGRSDRLPPDRTTPVLKAMTARQRAHARHFTKSQLGSSRMLDELQSVDVHEDGWVAPTQPTLDVLADLACASDAVLSGHVRSVQSFPTEDGRFLFSEYAVEALRVFRSMSRAGTPGTVLTVIRLGGEMTIDGRPVTATISSFPALSTNRRYLLFLKYHSDTDTFETASPAGTLEIRGQQLIPTDRVAATDEAAMADGIPFSLVQARLGGLSCR
jgi:hypothetical protein